MKTDLQRVPRGGWLAVKAHVCGEVQARLQVGEEEGGLLVCEVHLYGGAVQDGAAVVSTAVQLLGAHHRGGQGAVGTQGHTMRKMVSGEGHQGDGSTKRTSTGELAERTEQAERECRARTGNKWKLLPWKFLRGDGIRDQGSMACITLLQKVKSTIHETRKK